MSAPPVTLEPALAHLPARHRRAVAEQIGAASADPAAIANVLRDEARLEQIVRELPSEARALATELAFGAVDIESSLEPHDISRQAFYELELRGLALCYDHRWSYDFIAPLDLVPALRRVRARAHARRIPDVPRTAERELPVSEQLLHDAAAIGARIAHGGIGVKADGELYAKAQPKLQEALAPLAVPALDLGERRVELALELLQELGALRVSADALPGRNTRRELRLDRDLVGLLEAPFEQRTGLARVLRRRFVDLALIDALLDELAGRTVPLEALGVELIALFRDAHKLLEHREMPPPTLALFAVQLRALSGGAAIGLDDSGLAVAVTIAPGPSPTPDGPPCVAQGDFELVALREPLPHERAALLMVAEPVPGREHVVRITRERINSALAALRDPERILAWLVALAGELPQSVERTIIDWIRRAPTRARLRSAIMLDLGDRPELGERVAAELGPLLAERLAPGLLAVPAGALAAVEKAARRAGVALEPGLDRISGRWDEHPSYEDDAEPDLWRPTADDEDRWALPRGRLVSALEQDPDPDWAGRHGDGEQRLPIVIEADPELDFLLPSAEDLAPEELLADSWDLGTLVELRYAAASGTITEQVTVAELDDARVLVEDPASGEQHWRWLKGIVDVRTLAVKDGT